MIGVVLLTLLPMAVSAGLSFTRWDGLQWSGIEWVGLENYTRLIGIETGDPPRSYDPWYFTAFPGRPTDPLFYQALGNTIAYSVAAVPLGLTAALLLAKLSAAMIFENGGKVELNEGKLKRCLALAGRGSQQGTKARSPLVSSWNKI